MTQYQVSGREIARICPGRGTRTTETGTAASAAAPVAPRQPVCTDPGTGSPQKEEPADWKGLVETVQTLDNPVFAVDKSGIIVAWNHALEQLTEFLPRP